MRASTLKVVVGDITYHIDDPQLSGGLKASVTAIQEETTERGAASRIRHRDRINLDRARDRQKFAEASGIAAADLDEVRDRVLDFLAPAPPLGEGAPEEPDPAVRSEALELLEAPDLLDRLGAALRAFGYAGELEQPVLIFLVFVSRLLARPMNLVVGGPSAAGKTFVVELVARFFPPMATYALNGMSERLLAYTDADLRHRTLIVGEAAALHRDGIGATLLRSLAWEGRIVYETVESTSEGLKPRRIQKDGPTGFVTTTTKSVEPELETRVLTINVPDDRKATREIIRVTAERANGRRPEEPDLRRWHEAQRMLAEEGTCEVMIPFARRLAERFPSDQVRSRRDFTQILTLNQACAVLHQRQRDKDETGRIVATEADYAIVYELTASVFGAIAAEGVTAAVRETVTTVGELTSGTESATASLNQVAAALNLDKSAVSRRVRTALRGGFLVNEETGRGRPYKLRVGDPLPEARPALPTPEELFGPPRCNTATPQHQAENARNDAETGCCTGEDREMQHCNGSGVSAAGIDKVLQGQLQQPFPHSNAENVAERVGCCSVAVGKANTENRAAAAPVGCGAPRVCASLGPCPYFWDHGRCWAEGVGS